MDHRWRNIVIAAGLLVPMTTLLPVSPLPAAEPLDPPVEKGSWIVPAAGNKAEPYWGIKDGIAIGLWPTGGPRGLIRIYTPYLGQPRLRMINFIAIEPVVKGRRGFSELEHSKLHSMAGKAMWTTEQLDRNPSPRDPKEPAGGRIFKIGEVEALQFHVYVEPFENGSRPIIEVTLRQDRPHEVGFRVFAAQGSAAMQSCVLTATMGNYARLRHVWLADSVADAGKLWPSFRRDPLGFAPHRQFPQNRLIVRDQEVIVAATPSEADPEKAEYARDVAPHWKYTGKFATQYWRAPVQEGLVMRVNGRTTFWASKAPIPGGISIENFELEAPFKDGQESSFGVVAGGPEKLGLKRPK